MSTSLSLKEKVRNALVVPTTGIKGLVDDLFAVGRDRTVALDLKADICRIQLLIGEKLDETIEVPVRKSIVRAALAHIALLCNKRKPNSVSPYEGRAEVSVGSDPAVLYKVEFTNTSEVQHLALICLSSRKNMLDDVSKPSDLRLQSLAEINEKPVVAQAARETSNNQAKLNQ